MALAVGVFFFATVGGREVADEVGVAVEDEGCLVFVGVAVAGVVLGVAVEDEGCLVFVGVAVAGAVLGVGVDVSVGVFLGSRKAETGTCLGINNRIAAIRNADIENLALVLTTFAQTLIDRAG